MAARHILVTGFEPFAGDTANPSQELAKAMDGRVVADHAVRSLVLPVQHEAAGEIMRAALDAEGLAAVIHLGLAAGPMVRLRMPARCRCGRSWKS